jgi:hypothetical protein
MIRFCSFLAPFFLNICTAGVYDTLEFGDNRDTVTKKLKASGLVTQTVGSTFLGRTGLNGVFRCNAKLAGLTYHLYFDWNEAGLAEITLKSNQVSETEYESTIREAWMEAKKLFTQVYSQPIQSANYPNKNDFKGHVVLMTHLWHKNSKQSIMIGPGIEKGQSFLAIRFVNKKITPVRTPK